MNTIRKLRRLFLLLIIPTLLTAAAGSLLSSARADDAPQSRLIQSAKIKWVTQDSPSDGQANRLFIREHYSNSEASMQFQIDVILTGQEPHEPGSVRILFPQQIWHQRSTYYADGAVMSQGYGGMTFSVPDAPSEESAWHWEDAGNGQYAIVNDAAIDAAAQVMFQCTITGIEVSKIVDMRPSDPLKATVEATARGGGKDSMNTQELTAVIDTREFLRDPGAGMTGQVYSTPDSVPAGMKENLPGGPETANNYVYVRWRTWPYYGGTQYFSLDMDVWAGAAEGNGASIPGIILGESGLVSGGTVGMETSGEQAGEHYSRQTLRYGFDTNGYKDSMSRDVWAAYPTEQMQNNKTYTIRAAAGWTLTEADPERDGDPKEVSRAGAEASVNYTHSGWEYPPGQFGVYKYSGSQPSHTHSTTVKERPDGSTSTLGHKKDKTYEMAVGTLRNGQPVTLDYEVLTTGYGYSYTAGPTSEVPDLPEGWEQDPGHYLNWTYRMETTDDTVSVSNMGLDGDLGAGDYRFDNITVAAPEMFSYGRQTLEMYQIPGSEFGYKPDSSLTKPEVEIWVEKNRSGSWELYTTVQLRSGTKKVTFPADANVTGYRTVIATNQAACKLAVWPKVTILPSAHVLQLAEARLQDYTNVVLKNEVRQVTTFYWSAERQDEVLPEQTAWLEANDDYTTESSDSSLSTMTVAGFKVSGDAGHTDRVTNDPARRRIKVELYASVLEESNLTTRANYDKAVAAGAITPETSGTWYLLLPKYFEPNASTIQGRSRDRVSDVQVIENFRNSGRYMVVVKATLTPDPYSYSSYYGDKPQITMDMYVPWSDYDKIENRYATYYAAFESGNPGRLGNLPDTSSYYQTVGYPDVWPGTPGTYLYSISTPEIRRLMSDLDPDSDEEQFVYMRGMQDLRNIDISEQVEFRKDVRTDPGGTWGKGTRDENQVTVTEGGEYTYRLTVASRQDSKTSGILIYDAIEEYVPHEGYDQDDLNGKKAWSGDWNGRGQWKGTLKSVDLSELYNDGCKAQLYYSTKTGMAFDNNIDPTLNGFVNFDASGWGSDYRLTDRSIWTEVTGSLADGKWEVPEGLNVTAIAVDAQRFNRENVAAAYALAKGKKVSVYLHMAAPTDGGDDSKWSAKGAYDHKKDNASSPDDIDWTGAADPANNMYAYNEATVVFIPYAVSGSSELAQPRTMMNYAYTRVGIVPGVISVRKTWNDGEYVNGQYMENRDGVRPDSVTVRLKGQTADPDAPKIDQEITLTAEGGWKGVFLNAPETDGSGNAYAYTVTEDPVPGYTTAVYRENGRSYEIVNTHKKETIVLTGEKLWLNPDGTPAETTASSVTISYRRITSSGPENSTYGMTVRPDSTGRWIYRSGDLDRYEPGGFEYKYVLLENSPPEGWFSQNDTPPAGVTVTAEYDPEDITTFRNFKKPDFGYAMIYCYLSDESKPKDGNTATPSFTFTLDMTKDDAAAGGEYEYVLYDKAPRYTGSTALPEGTAQIGSGTIRNGDSFILPPEQTMVIIGIPGGTKCTVTETVGTGWNTNQYHDQVNGTIQMGRTQLYSFRNTYTATSPITITGTKRLRGREQKAKEFAFNLTDYNEFNDYGYENSSYGQVIATVKTGESRGMVTEDDGTKTGLAMFTFRASYDSYSTYEMHEYGGKKVLHYKAEEALPAGAQFNADGSVTFKSVIYDTDRKDVTVTLTDNGDGTLKITATPLVFTNTYRLRKNITLTAHKELKGRTLQPDEFSFEVRRSGAAAGSAPIAQGKNDADGNITFTPEITLSESDLASISPETGIGELKFLISEVQGTDPTVAYMTAPAEAVVQISQTADGEVLAALPGQEIRHAEETCTACGGTGEGGGLTATLLDETLEISGTLPLSPYFNNQHMDLCPDCGGTGYDPASPDTPCGTCGGIAASFREENGLEALHTGDGRVIWQYTNKFPLETILFSTSLDASMFPKTSYWVILGYVFTEEQWAAANGDISQLYSVMDTAALIYLGGSGGDTCSVCNGTGTVRGDPYVYGDQAPVAVTNYVKETVSFTAEKTMEGKPSSMQFDFVLLETDEYRRTETEIARTKNGTDGKIVFDAACLSQADTAPRYYVIREAAGTDNSIAYDESEDLYRVVWAENGDGSRTPEKTLLSGDGVFQNRYKDGALAVTVIAGNYHPMPPFFYRPVFPVKVTLKDRNGSPLANQSFTVDMETRDKGADRGPALTTDAQGCMTVRVEGGKTAVIRGLPHGAAYQAEQPAGSMPEGFTQSAAEGAAGTIRGGEESRVSFANTYGGGQPDTPTPTPRPTNTPKPHPKTGDGARPLLWLGLILLGLLGIGFTNAFRSGKRR